MKSRHRRFLVVMVWLSIPVILWLTLRNIPLTGLIATIQKLQIWQVEILVLMNAAIILMISSRWHLILKSLGQPVSFLSLVGYRLAGFAISYFTPGTQFGGEPLQVLLVQQRHSIPPPAVVTSVYLDKLFEILSNFTFLVVGLLVLFQHGFLSKIPNAWLGGLIPIILIFPAAHLIALWRGRRPMGALIRELCRIFPYVRLFCRMHDSVYQAEEQIMVFAHQKPLILLHSLFISTLAWMFMILEFGLVYRFLGANFSVLEVIIVMVLARFSFLIPIPAGLGALEGSQVLAMGLLGVDPAVGVAACVWIRLRDITLGLTGAWLGSLFAGKVIQKGEESVD